MKRKQIAILCIYCFLHVSNFISAVEIPNIILPSPYAQTFSKYGNYPVSNYTGVPSINIPLHTINLKDIKIPISISYNASGIKVNEEASRVGLGWQLEVGGVISRTIKGRYNDFISNVYFYNGHENKLRDLKDIYHFDKYTIGTYNYPFPFSSSMNKYEIYCAISGDDRSCGGIELAPDEFNYNFGGFSGKFIISRTGEIVKEHEDNVIITPVISIGVDKKEIESWIITTPDGTKYYFNQTEQAKYGVAAETKYNSAFYLSKIQTINNTIVTFEYIIKGSIYNLYNRVQNFSVTGSDISFTNTEYDVVYLSKINYPGGVINFNYIFDREDFSPEPKLESIFFSENETSWNFDYDYFVANATGQEIPTLQRINYIINSNANYYTQSWDTKRLKLNHIYQSNSNNEINNNFYFFYNENKLPTKLCSGIDHWGYYNGAINYNDLIPAFYQNTSQDDDIIYVEHLGHNANRNASPDNNQAFVLNRIIYPTGGRTDFSYETNDYKTSIIENDPHKVDFMYSVESTDLKEINYNNVPIDYIHSEPLNISVGVQNQYGLINVKVKVVLNDSYRNYSTANPTLYMNIVGNWSSSYIPWNYTLQSPDLPLASELNSQNRTIERSWTNISLYTGLYNIEVYGALRQYIDTTIIEVERIIAPTEFCQKNPVGLAGGLRIKEIASYDNVGTLLLKKKYKYVGDDQKTSGKLMYYPRYRQDELSLDDNGLKGAGYSVGYSKVHVIDIDKTGVEIGKSICDYVNKPDLNLYYTWADISSVGNGKSKDENPYGVNSFKYSENGTLLGEAIMMNNSGVYSTKSKTTYKYTFKGGGPNIVWGILKSKEIPYGSSVCLNGFPIDFFNIQPGNSRAFGYLYPAIRPMNVVLDQKIDSVFDQGVIETKTSYSHNLNYYYLTQEMITSSDNKVYTKEYKYPFDYGDTDSPMTYLLKNNIIDTPVETIKKVNDKVVYKETKQFETPPFISEIQTNTGLNNSMETRIKYEQYDQYGNPVYISKDDAIRVVYLWSFNGQYPIAEIKNATFNQVSNALIGITPNQIASSIVPDMGKVEALRTALPNALVTTFTYKPLVGMLTATDPRGVTTYYEYDDFNRLKQTYIIENGEKKILQKFDYHYANQQ